MCSQIHSKFDPNARFLSVSVKHRGVVRLENRVYSMLISSGWTNNKLLVCCFALGVAAHEVEDARGRFRVPLVYRTVAFTRRN